MTDLLLRIGGVVRKEIVEIVRQPGLIVILVLGPLAILLLFGSGVQPTDPAVRSMFVAPDDDPELADIVRSYADAQSERLTIVDVTTDDARATQALRTGEVDLVVSFPEVSLEELRKGERGTILVRHRFIDPLEAQAIRLFTRTAVDDLNVVLVSQAVAELQEVAEGLLADVDIDMIEDPESVELIEDLLDLEPSIVASPLEGQTESFGGSVTTSQFYGPAVVALILQHLVITFVALSVSRERQQGTIELFSVSPLRPVEHVAGRIVAYTIIGGALGAAMIAAVVLALGAPLRDGLGSVALILLGLLIGSIGLGFLLATLARTTTQVVQGAMLLLLMSVFFGGLLLSPDRLLPWARPIGWVLPMTHGLTLLRDSMLRGLSPAAIPLAAMIGLGGLYGLLALWRGRRVANS